MGYFKNLFWAAVAFYVSVYGDFSEVFTQCCNVSVNMKNLGGLAIAKHI